jgi:hypothetical protein
MVSCWPKPPSASASLNRPCKADPVMSALAQMVDRVGATTGRTLSLLAGDADEAALAIKDLTDIITGLITATGYIVHATATVRGWIDVSYDAARTAAYWIENNSALSKTLKDVGIQMDITRDAGRRLGGGTFAAAKGMDAAAAAAGGAVGPAVSPVSDRLWALGEIQRRLKAGNLSANMNSYLHNVAQGRLAEGGGVPGTSPHKKADNILIAATAGEHMWTVDEVQAAGGHQNVKKLRQMALSGALDPAAIAAYAGGGQIWPYVVNASKTRVPSVREAEAAVIPAVPAGGQTWRWIIQAARALVGAVRVISTVRPGAHTLSGNLSYHAMGRAVDFAPSMQLARKWNITYGRRTKEEITPWRQYDIWNGRAHHYSAALHAQHSGGNAHVHIAMAGGGRIGEPVVGVGASGKTYSFGEAGPEIVTPQASMSGGTTTIINVTLQNNAPIGSQMELDNWLVGSIDRLRYRVRV